MTKGAFQVLLVDGNQEAARKTREMLTAAEPGVFSISIADCLLGALNLLAYHNFDIALVDLSLPDATGLEALDTIRRHAPAMPVVLQTARAGDPLALQAVERGAQDYLVKGALTAEALVRVLSYSIVRSRSKAGEIKPEAPMAAITGVLGSMGGVGTTTVACRYAYELASQTGKRTLMVDLDLSGASAAFLLKAKAEYTMVEASTNLQRLDGNFWAGLVQATEAGFDLLAAPGAQQAGHTLENERVRHVLRFARTKYDLIVVDMGRLNSLALALLEDLKELYLVATPDLPALFEASRILKRLIGLGLSQQDVRLVINKSGRNASPQDIESALGYPVYGSFGDHGAELAEAFGDGQFFATNLQFQRQIASFTAKTLGIEEKKPAMGFRTRFLKLARA